MKGTSAVAATSGFIALFTSAAVCGDWFTIVNGSAGVEQDDSKLAIVCDDQSGEKALHPDSRGLILIFFSEPRANWKKNAEVEVETIADDGSRTIGHSHGIAMSQTDVMLKNDATWELSVMGNAKYSFTISADGYARKFSAIRLRETVAPVLEKCGDHW